jgi:hypothetical protein
MILRDAVEVERVVLNALEPLGVKRFHLLRAVVA